MKLSLPRGEEVIFTTCNFQWEEVGHGPNFVPTQREEVIISRLLYET